MKKINEPLIAAIRGRYDKSGKIEQQLEINYRGLSNALTTVQKDNVVIIPIEEYKKMIEIKEFLIGKSVTGYKYVSEDEAYLELNDGSLLEVSCDPAPDCCGYNDFSVNIPDGFDFSDNVITKVEYEEVDGYGDEGSISVGIFTNDTRIDIEGEWGSGSGWSYGQFVSIECIVPNKEENN